MNNIKKTAMIIENGEYDFCPSNAEMLEKIIKKYYN